MATQGMFGSQYQQAIIDEQNLRRQQAQTGGLTGWAAITNAMSGIGSELGYQAGQAMGGMTPAQMQQANYQSIIDSVPNFDPTNSDSVSQMASAMWTGGEYDMAMQFYDRSQDMKAADLQIQLAELKLQPESEKLLAFEKKINDVNELNIPQEEKDELIKKILAGVTTTIDLGAGQSKYAERVGTLKAEKDTEVIQFAEIAQSGFNKTNQVLALLAEGDEEVITGFGANVFLDIERFGTKIGAIKGGRVAKTQYLEALLGSDVFPMIKALGIGARGLDTPAERKFLQKVMTGDITMDSEAIERLTRLRQEIYKEAIEKYNKKLDSGKFKLYEESLSTDDLDYKLERMEIPNTYVAPPKPVIPEGANLVGYDGQQREIYEYSDGTFHLADGTQVEL